MSLYWYLRWKRYLLSKGVMSSLRSTRTYTPLFVIMVGYAILEDSAVGFAFALVLYILFSFYVDYIRGVPNKWIRRQIVNDYNKRKKEVIRDGGENSKAG